MSSTPSSIEPLDPYALAALQDQSPVFDRYRTIDPVHWGLPLQPGLPGCWYLTRYDDIVSVIRSEQVGHARVANANRVPAFDSGAFSIDDVLDRWFVFMDGGQHQRLRSVLGKPLKALASEATRRRLEQLSGSLIDGFAASDAIDLLPLYSYPLPVIAMAELMGFPPEDHGRLISWAQAFIQVFDLRNAEIVARVQKAFAEFFQYLGERLAERRGSAADDLLGVLARAESEATITHDELLCTAALLLLAGAETTPTLIGNAVWLLSSHPGTRAEFLADHTVTASAIDEIMRFESPVQLTGRHALVDFELRGKRIAKGDYVVALYGAANRDPNQFPEPSRFDIRRTPNRHLGFGVGVHACVGGALGHLIGQVAVRTLFERLPHLAIETPDADWRGHGSIRGLQSLCVRSAGDISRPTQRA